jgi:hypothetical protein
MSKFATESKWLKHTDLEEGRDHLVTVKEYKHENLASPGQPKQEKWVVYFEEFDRGLGLNATNGKMLCKLFNTEEMDEWIGKQCLLYVKDDVEYQGEIVSAIRVRPKLPGSKKSVQKPTDPNDLITKINLAQSIEECRGIQREIALAEPMSDDDRDALNLLVTQKMQELKGGKVKK